jgi:hypothetical protein
MAELGVLGVDVLEGDGEVDLTGTVALDHRFRLGVITGRARDPRSGTTYWTGQVVDWTQPPGAAPWWRWTAARPLVVARTLREYVDATDDLLGLEELRRRRLRRLGDRP